MNGKIKVGIIGASGYGAGELLRLLANHSAVEIVSLVSSSSDGAHVHDIHPHLRGLYPNLKCSAHLDKERLIGGSGQSVVFCALPHGTSGNYALSIVRDRMLPGVRVIDLSGDLRLRDPSLAGKWYPETEFVEAERSQIVYGLTEMNKEHIRRARLVANPGCLAAATILALAPLARERMIKDVIIDAKTGSSGAGRTPHATFHHPSMHGNCFAYKVLHHRHEPEIMEALGNGDGKKFTSMFVPHVIPASRGILVTCYLPDAGEMGDAKLTELYQNFYHQAPFVQIVPAPPELHSIVGSNYCQISIAKRGKQLVVMAALDNLVKGMAGMAIQNMNCMFGLVDSEGLLTPSLGLV